MMVTGYGFDAQTVFDTEVPKGRGIRPAAPFSFSGMAAQAIVPQQCIR